MVSIKAIRSSNALLADATVPRVAVFAGGTSGIGKFTVRALAATGAPIRIYLVGRPSAAVATASFIAEVHALNPRAEIVWTEAEIALLADVRRVCELIRAKEPRVDLLFLSAGYAPFGGRREVTAEGVGLVQSLEYYSRVLFVMGLLPALRAAEAGRVISVLAGGAERVAALRVDDMDLEEPGVFGAIAAQSHFAALNTVALDKLAEENPGLVFIHSWPGWVDTGNGRRGAEEGSWMAWVVRWILEPIMRAFSFSHEDSGQRYLFQCTSAAYGGHGVPWDGEPGVNSVGMAAAGMFRVKFKCDCAKDGVVPALREKADDKVWKHTLKVLAPYL
ncbi:hypothetical protein C8A05DRAFT_16245 [Staphylotrichum tortipilum]|uniref:Uncharacterized protein n=1 Tax=Staphylotrichum tortipilum TaxID=2831512 RepID=A0AAN6MIM9_9PEZI|nr:hypothetical protein C8A05DRAFT_16245 [Staphylotrichum longicolle]